MSFLFRRCKDTTFFDLSCCVVASAVSFSTPTTSSIAISPAYSEWLQHNFSCTNLLLPLSSFAPAKKKCKTIASYQSQLKSVLRSVGMF